jgi:hypothetical protein
LRYNLVFLVGNHILADHSGISSLLDLGNVGQINIEIDLKYQLKLLVIKNLAAELMVDGTNLADGGVSQ